MEKPTPFLLDKEIISELLELSVDSSFSILEIIDKIGESDIPYGKLLNFIVKKIVEKKDYNEAVSCLFYKSYLLSIIEVVKASNLNIEINKTYLSKIKDLSKYTINLSFFDIDDVDNSQVYQHYKSVFSDVFEYSKINKQNIDFLFRNFDFALKVKIYFFLEKSVVFNKLNNYLNLKSVKLYKNRYVLEKFRLAQYSSSLDKSFFNDKILKLYYYVSPSFSFSKHFANNNNDLVERSIFLSDSSLNEENKAISLLTENERKDLGIIKNTPIDFYNINIEYSLDEYLLDFCSNVDNLNIRNTATKVLLLFGYPGQGKTLLCENLIYNTYSQKNSFEPILIKLRLIRSVRQALENPINVFFDYLENIHGLPKNLLKINECVFILDGLDEIYMREGISIKEIEQFIRELCRLTEIYPGLKFIVTSRYGYVNYHELINEATLNVLRINAFSLEKQIIWFKKFKSYNEVKSLSADSIFRYNKSVDYQYIAELLGIPFLLTLVSILPKPIPEYINRAKLYDFLFTEIIERKYNNLQRSENISVISPAILRELIREIAYSIFKTGNTYIKRNDLLKNNKIKNILKLFPNKNFHDSINGLLILFYFKETKLSSADDEDNYALEFLHQSLHEYMVAEYIISDLNSIINNEINNTPEYLLDYFFITFSSNNLSQEITDYIKNIIAQFKDADRFKEIIIQSLPFFIENNFISRNHYVNSPIEAAYKTFFGINSILRSLRIFTTELDPNVRREYNKFHQLSYFIKK